MSALLNPPFPNLQWFVVHAKPKQEARALENLERQGFESWLPMMDIEKVRNSRVHVVTEPMFSRYLFVRMDKNLTHWGRIRSTLGVHRLVTFGNLPVAVPEEIMKLLQEAKKPSVEKLLKPGDAVQFIDGPLKGLEGIFQQPSGEMRAMVLIELLSQPQRIRADLRSLRPANS